MKLLLVYLHVYSFVLYTCFVLCVLQISHQEIANVGAGGAELISHVFRYNVVGNGADDNVLTFADFQIVVTFKLW